MSDLRPGPGSLAMPSEARRLAGPQDRRGIARELLAEGAQ